MTANLRLTYEAPLWGGDFTGTVSGYYNSWFYCQTGNLAREDDYAIVNMRLSWKDRRGITYSLWGNNLTDAVYNTHRNAQPLGGDSVSLPAQRKFGVGVAFGF